MSSIEPISEKAAAPIPLPTSSRPTPTTYTPLRRALLITGTLLLLPVAHHTFSNFTDNTPSIALSGPAVSNACVQAPAVPYISDTARSDFIFENDTFKAKEVERFLGAIRIPTQSYDDMTNAKFEEGEGYDVRFDGFKKLHAYLEETYPLIYEKTTLANPHRFNLVYTLRGSEPKLKPLVLTAHQDVVPAPDSTLDRWTYPPFKGVFDGEYIWGRGSSDCKNSLIAIMTALEHRLEQGWKNRRTLVLAFGFDEEIGGPQGASAIGKHLLDTYGPNGVAMLVDEGGSGVEEKYGKLWILPGTAEKGNVSPAILVETEGGHSSTPSVHTGIGILSRIVASVEDANLFPPTLHTSSPVYGYMNCVATHGVPSLVPSWLKKGLQGKQTQKALDKLAAAYAEVRGRMAGEFLVRTSKAVTLISGGHKLNALPESARAVFNSRIDFSQSPETVLDIYTDSILPTAEAYNFTLISFNKTVLHEGSDGTIRIDIQGDDPLAPAPLTPVHGQAWDLFGWASRRVFEKDGEDEVIVSPSAATGNTDTKWYWDLTKNIYRFVPRRIGTSFAAHTVDEKILFKTHLEGLAWYHELILLFDDIKTDEGF
ncbi:carboxypeptidase s [Phaffia rhodozyma]|uniref:Carboxypeptidase s n=1 Tax=Phaffia rhodozyma TaxID=264483 RepID=A0A0F7ST41_PHARH|nr:carboxypeptidase s [Phaffia rhodozyma]